VGRRGLRHENDGLHLARFIFLFYVHITSEHTNVFRERYLGYVIYWFYYNYIPRAAAVKELRIRYTQGHFR